MVHTICLDKNFSTTRMVTNEKPEIVNSPEDKFETVLFLPVGEGRKGEGGLRTKGYFKKSFKDKPLISVITVVFNGAKYLEETIKSVINQTYDNVEYIIIDGGSTDGTIDIIKKYEDRIDYWVSEKDKGIYDGMNKGIALATGELINLLNCGDEYYNNEVIKVIVDEYLKLKNKRVDIIHGDIIIKTLDNKLILRKFNPSRLKLRFYGMTYNHPSFFVTKSFYGKCRYDDRLCYISDYKFVLEATYRFNANFYYIPYPLVVFIQGGASYRASLWDRLKEGYLAKRGSGFSVCESLFSQIFRGTVFILLRILRP